MTLEYLWYVNDDSCEKLNFAKRNEELAGVMDFNINTKLNFYEDEYLFNLHIPIKKIVFVDNIPYFQTPEKRLIQVYAIHFLGPAKQYMKSYAYKENLRLHDYIIYYLKRIKSILKRGFL